jgi:hypothetical protein
MSTRFLSSPYIDTLLADLAQHGFTFDPVQPFQFATNGTDTAIYLGQLDNDFCANVTACEELTFATERDAPEVPYNIFV